MINFPTEPSPGDSISAQTIRDIIRCLRRFMPMAGKGIRIDSKPNGTIITNTVTSISPASYTNLGACWNIDTDDEGNFIFVNKYYQVGGNVYEFAAEGDDALADRLDQYVLQGELEDGYEYTDNDKPFVYLRINMTEVGAEPAGKAMIVGKKNWEDVVSDANDVRYYVKPLYKLTHYGYVKIDYRNIPQVVSFEISSLTEKTT